MYGVEAPWLAQRRLESFEGWFRDRWSPEPPTSVWLGHLDSDGSAGVSVGTWRVDRMDLEPPSAPLQEDDRPLSVEVAFARRAIERLVGIASPDPGRLPRSSPQPACGTSGVIRQLAAGWSQWPRLTWSLDGERVSVPTCHFAGGWAGFTVVSGAVAVTAVGIGVPAAELHLVEVTDGSSYGFDLHAPLDRHWPGRDEQQTRDDPGTVLRRPTPSQWHTDYLQFGAEP